MCTVKPYYISAKRFGLFAVRLPSLSRGNGLGYGITFDIFTHNLHGSYFEILLILHYIKVLIRVDEKKYTMAILKMDITSLYLQEKNKYGLNHIYVTNNSYTIYIYRDTCVYRTNKVLDEGHNVAPCNNVLSFSNIEKK